MSTEFPIPHIIEPSQPHTHTCILLHGRGSSGEEFADELFESQTSTGKHLPQSFPTWKWIFPTAMNRWSTMFREEMTEWFHIKSLADPDHERQLQVDDLRTSIKYVWHLIEEEHESKRLPYENIILGGISQGCAVVIHSLLSGGNRLAAFLGFSSWLPFQKDMDELISHLALSNDEVQSKQWLLADFYSRRFVLHIPTLLPSQNPGLDTPVFLAHCADDEVVSIDLGKKLRETIKTLGLPLQWVEYDGGGHWIREPEMLDDLVDFVRRHALQ